MFFLFIIQFIGNTDVMKSCASLLNVKEKDIFIYI